MIKQELEKIIAETLNPTGQGNVLNLENIKLVHSSSHTGADYTLLNAFALAKEFGANVKPEKVAKILAANLRGNDKISPIANVEVKNGFINFFISEVRLRKEVMYILEQQERYGAQDIGKGNTIVVDYSGPNIAKRFSVGHLRSTVIGQALYNLYRFLGYQAVGDNHLGDWGTQFGMIIAQIARKDLDAHKLTVEDLEQLYVEFNQEMKVDPPLRDQAKFWFKKLEEGDSSARVIWQAVVNTSMAEFEKIYQLLNIHIDHAYSEAFYEDKMPLVLEALEKKGLVKDSQGARVVEVGQDMPPAIIIKSDGTTTYLLRDLATIQLRLQQWHPEKIIYEVGSDQILHFRQLFAIAHMLGWHEGVEFKHVAHGLIRLESGKMSTRQGKTIKLEEVLEEAIARARHIIERSETGRGLDEQQKEEVARAVGIGAVKYFDLSHHPASDIIFDWEKLFMLEGNSAPYLQYTYARIQSILDKAATPVEGGEDVFQEAEASVARVLIRFPEVVSTSALQYAPNLLANFLFELAQAYNNFYAHHHVLGSPQEAARLTLSKATGQVLKNGLTLLGIALPHRM